MAGPLVAPNGGAIPLTLPIGPRREAGQGGTLPLVRVDGQRVTPDAVVRGGANPVPADTRPALAATDASVAIASPVAAPIDPQTGGARLAEAIRLGDVNAAKAVLYAQTPASRQAIIAAANAILGPLSASAAAEAASYSDPMGLSAPPFVPPASFDAWVGMLRPTDRNVMTAMMRNESGTLEGADRIRLGHEGFGTYADGIFQQYEGKTAAQIRTMEATYQLQYGETVDNALTRGRFAGWFAELSTTEQARLRMMRLGTDGITPQHRAALAMFEARQRVDDRGVRAALEPHIGDIAGFSRAYLQITGRRLDREFSMGGDDPISNLIRGDRTRYLGSLTDFYARRAGDVSLAEVTRAFGAMLDPTGRNGPTLAQVEAHIQRRHDLMPMADTPKTSSVAELLREYGPGESRQAAAALADRIVAGGGADVRLTTTGRTAELTQALTAPMPSARELLAALRAVPVEQRAAVEAELRSSGRSVDSLLAAATANARGSAEEQSARSAVLRAAWGSAGANGQWTSRFDAADTLRAAQLGMIDQSAVLEAVNANAADGARIRENYDSRYGGPGAFDRVVEDLSGEQRAQLRAVTGVAGAQAAGDTSDAVRHVRETWERARGNGNGAQEISKALTESFGMTAPFVDDSMLELVTLLDQAERKGGTPTASEIEAIRGAHDRYRRNLQAYLTERGQVGSAAGAIAGAAAATIVSAVSGGTLAPIFLAAIAGGATDAVVQTTVGEGGDADLSRRNVVEHGLSITARDVVTGGIAAGVIGAVTSSVYRGGGSVVRTAGTTADDLARTPRIAATEAVPVTPTRVATTEAVPVTPTRVATTDAVPVTPTRTTAVADEVPVTPRVTSNAAVVDTAAVDAARRAATAETRESIEDLAGVFGVDEATMWQRIASGGTVQDVVRDSVAAQPWSPQIQRLLGSAEPDTLWAVLRDPNTRTALARVSQSGTSPELRALALDEVERAVRNRSTDLGRRLADAEAVVANPSVRNAWRSGYTDGTGANPDIRLPDELLGRARKLSEAPRPGEPGVLSQGDVNFLASQHPDQPIVFRYSTAREHDIERTMTVRDAIAHLESQGPLLRDVRFNGALPARAVPPSVPAELASKFPENWLRGQTDPRHIISTAVQLRSGQIASYDGNVESLLAIARRPDVVSITTRDGVGTYRPLISIPAAQRGADFDYQAVLRSQLGPDVVTTGAHLVGTPIHHGTLDAMTASVTAGPRNVGGGLGGRGLYLALGDESYVADYFASYAVDNAAARLTSGGANAALAGTTRPVVMSGTLGEEARNWAVGRFTVSRDGTFDLRRGILPSDWERDASLRRLLEQNFDAIEVLNTRTQGFAIATDRFLVVHERAGAGAFTWGGIRPMSNDAITDYGNAWARSND